MGRFIYIMIALTITSIVAYITVEKNQDDSQKKLSFHKKANAILTSTDSSTNSHTEVAEAIHMPNKFSAHFARIALKRILKIKNTLEQEKQLQMLYKTWMSKDPLDAINYINTLEDYDITKLLYKISLSTWAKNNTAEFDDWINHTVADPRFNLALKKIILDTTSPEHLAIHWSKFITDKETANECRELVILRWLNKESSEAINWALGSDVNQLFLRSMFEILAETNTEQAFIDLALLDKQGERLLTQVLTGIRNYLNEDNINQNVIMAIQMLPNTVRQLTLKMIMPRLAKTDDPAGIGHMIEKLPDNYMRTAMLETLAFIWAEKEPQSAAEFAIQIPKSDRQAQVITAVVTQWHQKDIESTSRWLNNIRGEATSTDRAAQYLASHAANTAENVEIASTWVDRIENPKIKSNTAKDVTANWFFHNEEAAQHFLSEQNLFTPEEIHTFINDQKTNKELILQQAARIKKQRESIEP